MSAEPEEKVPPEKAKRPSARERICETARGLFYQHGIRGVGVEMIAAEAGTTKMSLYRNFVSKDELVAECLCEQEREFWAWWEATVEPFAGQPRRQIEALFDSLQQQAAGKHWARGCVFTNAAVELPDEHHPAHKVILQHHRAIRQRFHETCREMDARNPETLANALVLLMTGVFGSCLVFKSTDSVKSVGETVRALLCSELGPPRSDRP